MAGNVPNVSMDSFNWVKLYDQVIAQQGMPIPDNDMNESRAIDLANHTMLLAWAIGDVKMNLTSTGKGYGLAYEIQQATSTSQNFAINRGWAIVRGVMVPTVMGDPPSDHDYESDTNLICEGTISTVSSPNITSVDKKWSTDYDLANCRMKMTSGAESGNTFTIVARVSDTELQLSSVGSIAPTDTYIIKPPSLTTYGGLGTRTDEVYLAVWWEDINENEDSNIVNPGLAIETSHRSQRRWCVRVAENGTTPTSSTRHGFGFRYMKLAELARTSLTGANILTAQITNEDNFTDPITWFGPEVTTWLDKISAEPVVVAQTAPALLASGTHDGGDGQTNLTDSGASWTTDEWQNRTVGNVTSRFTAKISSNTATVATCASQKGGNTQVWNNGDTYRIYDNAFQLTGDFYIGNGGIGTAGDFFAARDKDDPGRGYNPGGWIAPGKSSGVVFRVFDTLNATELTPSAVASSQGFYTNPYLRAYRPDSEIPYEATLLDDLNVVCFERVSTHEISDSPAKAFPLAGLSVRADLISGARVAEVEGSPDSVAPGIFGSTLNSMMEFINDRVRKDLADTITASHTFDSIVDSKGQLWVSKWIGSEASTYYDGFGTAFYPDAGSKYDISNNNYGPKLDEVGDYVYFSEFLPPEYESGERLVLHAYFRLINAETASNKIYARLLADIFSEHDTSASVSDIRSVAHNIGSDNAANTVHEVVFVVNNSSLRPLDVCKFRISLYDVISGDAVSEVAYLGTRFRYRAYKIAPAWTSWPAEG